MPFIRSEIFITEPNERPQSADFNLLSDQFPGFRKYQQ
jgi:hypothetical protein